MNPPCCIKPESLGVHALLSGSVSRPSHKCPSTAKPAIPLDISVSSKRLGWIACFDVIDNSVYCIRHVDIVQLNHIALRPQKLQGIRYKAPNDREHITKDSLARKIRPKFTIGLRLVAFGGFGFEEMRWWKWITFLLPRAPRDRY